MVIESENYRTRKIDLETIDGVQAKNIEAIQVASVRQT